MADAIESRAKIREQEKCGGYESLGSALLMCAERGLSAGA